MGVAAVLHDERMMGVVSISRRGRSLLSLADHGGRLDVYNFDMENAKKRVAVFSRAAQGNVRNVVAQVKRSIGQMNLEGESTTPGRQILQAMLLLAVSQKRRKKGNRIDVQ